MENEKIVKAFFRKYFSHEYLDKTDAEFKAFLRVLNKKDKVIEELKREVRIARFEASSLYTK